MTLHRGKLNIGTKRVLAIVTVAISILYLLPRIHSSNPVTELEFSPTRSFRSVFSRTAPLKFSSFRYEAPQDLVVPQWQGKQIETESLIGKVTILFHGRDPTYIRAIQTHQAHNRHYGYPLLALRHAILNGIWSKPAYLLAVLLEELRKPDGQRLKWLFWVDADTVVTNPKIPLEIFLPPEEFPHLHLLVTADPHGINNGIFFIKVHAWSVQLLCAIIAYPTFRPDAELIYRDQSALEEVLKEKAFRRNFAILPQRWINAYQDERDGSRTLPFQILPGDFLVHFPGVPGRDERMRHYLDIVERHWPKWEIDLESTTYPKEISEYWTEKQGMLAKERTLAQEAAKEAREYLNKCQDALKEYQARLGNDEYEAIEKSIKVLRDALEDDRDDIEIVKDAQERLKKSAAPLRRLIEEPKKALLNDAQGLVSQGEQLLSQRSGDSGMTDEEVKDLRSKKDALQHLLAEAADDQDAIRQAVDDLGKTTAKAKSKLDEKAKPDAAKASSR